MFVFYMRGSALSCCMYTRIIDSKVIFNGWNIYTDISSEALTLEYWCVIKIDHWNTARGIKSFSTVELRSWHIVVNVLILFCDRQNNNNQEIYYVYLHLKSIHFTLVLLMMQPTRNPLYGVYEALLQQCPVINVYKYSLLMHRIKIISPTIVYGMNKTFFWVDLSLFNQSYSGGIKTAKKPTGYWRYYHSRCRPPCCHGRRHGAWRPHHERLAYTSNFVQYIYGF